MATAFSVERLHSRDYSVAFLSIHGAALVHGSNGFNWSAMGRSCR